jgi:peroxiredoxin Q/BCP
MKAPNFSLSDQNGKTHSLNDYQGKWIVLYFYPKDNTPGCTKEACSFRDFNQDIKDQGAVILGISKDPVSSHEKFANKFDLNFPILSDEDHKVIEAYGAWGEKSMFGKKYMGTNRYTFIINPEGEIVKEYKKVKPAEHGNQVLSDLEKLQSN